jgi:hypothetical protein
MRIWGRVLIFVGVVLTVLAPVFHFYVTPQVATAPLRCTGTILCDNGTLLSPAAGTASQLFDTATLSTRTDVPLTAQRRVRSVPALSTPDQTIYNNFPVVTDSDGNLVDSTRSRYGFNGRTSQMVDCCDANVNGTTITDFSGLMPLKFPFFTKQQDYPYFDDTTGKAYPAKFVGTETVEGLSLDKFVQTITPVQVGTITVPGDLVGASTPAYRAPRYYSNVRTIWVEPTTGVIVKGSEAQVQTLRGPDGTDHVTLIKGTLTFTDENVSGSATLAKQGKQKLDLLGTTIPFVCLLLGLVALGVGAWLLVRSREPDDPAQPAEPAAAPVNA